MKLTNNNNNNKNKTNSINQDANNKSKFIPIFELKIKNIPIEYLPEIWNNLKTSEKNAACSPKHSLILQQQTQINFSMRSILINWLISVHDFYLLLPETLHMSISIIDRYLSQKEVLPVKLQLLGITALFIAAKYEEIFSPEIEILLKTTEHAYCKEDILQMENEVFHLLKFDITYPSAFRFFEILSLNYNFSEMEFFYGCFLLDYFTISEDFNKYFPSVIALGIMLALFEEKEFKVCGSSSSSEIFVVTGMLEFKLEAEKCKKDILINKLYGASVNLKAAVKKYVNERFHFVAQRDLVWLQSSLRSSNARSGYFVDE